MIKHSGGLIKNGKQANYVLLGFVTVAVVASFLLFFGGGLGISKNQATIDKTMKLHSDSFKFKQ